MSGTTFAIVTATIDLERSAGLMDEWLEKANGPVRIYVVEQGAGERDWQRFYQDGKAPIYRRGLRDIAGVVPAFKVGLHAALHDGAQIIACLHDDLQILDTGWDLRVRELFQDSKIGLLGFGGATGLGDSDIYQTPYKPMQLVRKRFGSNMRDAEAHGERWTEPRQVACLDGFSQIGRREFWQGYYQDGHGATTHHENLFLELEDLGVIHHAYDSALGAYAALGGWQTWFLPVAVHHFGGQTAVGDPRYHAWADQYTEALREHDEFTGRGDQWFWEKSHRAIYDKFKDQGVLPLRIE